MTKKTQNMNKGSKNIFRAKVDLLVLYIMSKGFSLAIAFMLSFPKRERMSHNNGIAGTGTIRIVDNPEFPPHDFFEPGKVYPARIRHAMITFLDDAMNGVRSIAIKFSHHHFNSPFDLEMNTGEISLFWSCASFLKFATMRKEAWGIQYQEFYRKYPAALQGAIETLRREPSSFTNLKYYNKTPYLFIGKDGIKRYAKYRVIPFIDQPETGLNLPTDEYTIANQRIFTGETRGRNYLKNEFEERVKREGAKYRIQIQTRISQDDEDPIIFNNMVPWEIEKYPYHDLAVIDIDTALGWEESLKTSFNIGHVPANLGLIPPTSIYDYNSLNYMRAHSKIARKARLFSYKVWGYPPPIPDNDNRNAEDWGV